MATELQPFLDQLLEAVAECAPPKHRDRILTRVRAHRAKHESSCWIIRELPAIWAISETIRHCIQAWIASLWPWQSPTDTSESTAKDNEEE